MKSKILAMLRDADGYLSGQELSARLGVSRAAVWKAVEKLRREGYTIQSAPNRGYCLAQATKKLCREEILAHLPENFPWQESLLCMDSVDSTNTRLKALAAQGAPHGTVMVADQQTGGRGRRGRGFASPSGMGVYLSVLLRPSCPPDKLMHLTCAVAEAMCQAVEHASGLRPGIKWTNDLVTGGKKLSGILTELSLEAESGTVDYAVVGIGVNCCQSLSDFPEEIQEIATSLKLATGREIDRNALAAAMISALYTMDDTLLTHQAEMLDAYRRDCVTLGREVVLLRGAERRYGTALSVDEAGALVVEFADGSREAVNSGEVSVRGMYGYA